MRLAAWHRRAPVLLVAGLLACSPAPAPVVPRPPAGSHVPAPALAAVDEAIEACERRPRDAAAFERLGRVYHGNELPYLAARSYEIALGLGSEEPSTGYLLGLILMERGEAVAAVTRMRDVVSREPRYAPAHYNLGQALLDAGRPEEAVAGFREAARLEPDEAAFHAGLGRALRQAGRLDEAVAALGRALALDPARDDAHQLLGLTLRALGREAESIEHLDRVGRRTTSVVRDPWLADVQRLAATAEVLVARARAHLREGRVEGAIDLLEDGVAAHPQHAVLARLLGDAHLRAGDVRRAAEAYARAAHLDPGDAEAHAALAVALLQGGDREGAEREATLALAADPQHAQARVVAAAAAVQRGAHAEALETLAPVLEHGDDLAAAHLVRGEALAALGRLAEAAEAFARAAELEPRSDYPRRRLEETRRALARGAGQ